MSAPSLIPPVILASTSPYRRELLSRLRIAFETARPDVDENPLPGESAERMVARLAQAKARAVAGDHPGALIIGSDQVAVLDDEVLGKPGDHARATAQLRSLSGRRVRFLTGLCLLDTRNDRTWVETVPFDVCFRPLDDARIERYLQQERPYDCAGSFRSEGLGITLFERLEGDDPTALIGLPLIRLTDFLAEAGVYLP